MKTSLTFGKTIQEDIFGNKTRYLDCTITVKGNNAESTMWEIVEIMNRELKEYGFEFNDGYGVEEGQAYNTMSILFETGCMTEYKEAVREAYRVAKAELKENKEVKAEVEEVQTEVHNIIVNTTLEEVKEGLNNIIEDFANDEGGKINLLELLEEHNIEPTYNNLECLYNGIDDKFRHLIKPYQTQTTIVNKLKKDYIISIAVKPQVEDDREEVSAEQEYLLKIMTENNFTLEYGQQSLLDEVLEKCDDYYFNGVSSYKIGYYWYTITLDGVEYDLYSKNK